MYYDGQFDDARLAVTLAQTAADHGAVRAQLHAASPASRSAAARSSGVEAVDRRERAAADDRAARVVVNATGIFADAVRRLDDRRGARRWSSRARACTSSSTAASCAGDAAIMVPHTDDGRVLFVIPWHGRVLVGTTDTAMPEPEMEPRPLADEIEFILRNAGRYLARDPVASGTCSARSPASGRSSSVPGNDGSTKELSRSHEVLISELGPRDDRRRQVDDVPQDGAGHDRPRDRGRRSAASGRASPRTCRLHGWSARRPALAGRAHAASTAPTLAGVRGARRTRIPGSAEPLHPRLPYPRGARDLGRAPRDGAHGRGRAGAPHPQPAARRARLDRRRAARPPRLLAGELGRDAAWAEAQANAYRALARGYLLGESESV